MAKPGSLADALRLGCGQPVSRLERLMLLEHVLGKPREYLLAHDDELLSCNEQAAYSELLKRRSNGQPMAYLIGQREFFGLGFAINDQVLIPRPETEWLVHAAIRMLPEGSSAIDLGTGSGAIAVSLAFHRPDVRLMACDQSTKALTLAAQNAKRLLGYRHRIEFFSSDWWNRVPEEPLALALANPPYLAFDDPHLAQGDLRFEPRLALSDGGNGLGAIEAITAGFAYRSAIGLIEDPAVLLIEHGHLQAEAVKTLGLRHRLFHLLTASDAAGHPRVCCLAAKEPSAEMLRQLKDLCLTWSSGTA